MARALEAGMSLEALGVEWRLPLFVLFPKDWPLENAALEALNDHVFTPGLRGGGGGRVRGLVGDEEEARALARGLRSLLGGLAALVREWGGKEALGELWAGPRGPREVGGAEGGPGAGPPGGELAPPLSPSSRRGPVRDGGWEAFPAHLPGLRRRVWRYGPKNGTSPKRPSSSTGASGPRSWSSATGRTGRPRA